MYLTRFSAHSALSQAIELYEKQPGRESGRFTHSFSNAGLAYRINRDYSVNQFTLRSNLRNANKSGKRALSVEQARALVARDKANDGHGRAAIARDLGISRETLYQYLRHAA